jgi:hypothetical protein
MRDPFGNMFQTSILAMVIFNSRLLEDCFRKGFNTNIKIFIGSIKKDQESQKSSE